MSASETPTSSALGTAALKIDDLKVAYLVRGIPREVLRGVSFEIAPGEAYGLVGESGCGKSTTAYAALRYLPSNGRITGGHVYVDGMDVTAPLVEQAFELLAPGGWLIVEVGTQASLTRDCFARRGYEGIAVRRDLAGLERVVLGRRPG